MTKDQKDFAFWNGLYRNTKSIANLIDKHKADILFWSELYGLIDRGCVLIKAHKVDPLQARVRAANSQARVVGRG